MAEYLVMIRERADGPQCNNDMLLIIESDEKPTHKRLKDNFIFYDGNCTNVSFPGCENCGGSHVELRVTEYDPVTEKIWKEECNEFNRDIWYAPKYDLDKKEGVRKLRL